MADLLVTYSNATGTGDYGVADGDLADDATLDSDVLVSLFTDRVADPGDKLPPGDTDPRGWWGDEAFLQDSMDAPPDLIGSKLWLRRNALLTQATLNQICQDIQQALQWMTEDALAQSVTCTGKQLTVMTARFVITIARMVDGQAVNTVYDAVWNSTLGLISVARQGCAQ